jgi:hypothetical protein
MHIYDRFHEFARTAASLFLALELGYDERERERERRVGDMKDCVISLRAL